MKTEDKAKYDGAGTEPKRYLTFEDLEVYRFAREFRKKMYEVNRQLPSFEKFELGSQIRRAAVSLTKATSPKDTDAFIIWTRLDFA